MVDVIIYATIHEGAMNADAGLVTHWPQMAEPVMVSSLLNVRVIADAIECQLGTKLLCIKIHCKLNRCCNPQHKRPLSSTLCWYIQL